jgi:hypothetical protein
LGYLERNFTGITIDENQNNPFQPDVDYHSFTAYPLLGTLLLNGGRLFPK